MEQTIKQRNYGYSVMDSQIDGIFPTPLYMFNRGIGISDSEKEEFNEIIGKGLNSNIYNSTTKDTHIFKNRLFQLRSFCEECIGRYVRSIISPRVDMDFFITQSWINVTKTGESHQRHCHQNSIISGVYYHNTIEDDSIVFIDPNNAVKDRIQVLPLENNIFNSNERILPVKDGDLVLFPSYMEHHVDKNETETERISLAFNVFARGLFGDQETLTELKIS